MRTNESLSSPAGGEPANLRESTAFRAAVDLPALDHPHFDTLLATALPDVDHERHSWRHHSFSDGTGSTVLVHLVPGENGRTNTMIAELGPQHLWDQLVGVATGWFDGTWTP